jgi:hypothetical protein
MKNPTKNITIGLDELVKTNNLYCKKTPLDGEVLTDLTENPINTNPTNLICIFCNYNTQLKQNYLKHLTTLKHKNIDKTPKKVSKDYTHTCTICNYSTFHKNDYDKHLNTSKHKNVEICNVISEMNQLLYTCKHCKYETKNKQHYTSHIKTKRHQYNANSEETLHQPPTIVKLSDIVSEDTSSNNVTINKEIFYTIIKQNEDFKQLLIEQNGKLIDLAKREHNVNSHNTTHNNNNFNLNFFLNEQCKDALNLTDFIASINPSFQDLEYVGKNGYVSGITKIIMDSLSQLDIYKRPVHCTDVKREVLHVKDDDKWDRDTGDNKKIKKLITSVADKNLRLVCPWQSENPASRVLDSPQYNLWFKIMQQSLNVKQEDKNNKDVLKNIAKNVYVDKIEQLSQIS